MATNPNDPNTNPTDPAGIPPKKPQAPKDSGEDHPLDLDATNYDLAPLPEDSLSEYALPEAVPPLSDVHDGAVNFDAPVPTADPASVTIGGSLEDLRELAGLDPTSLSELILPAAPPSGVLTGHPVPPPEPLDTDDPLEALAELPDPSANPASSLSGMLVPVAPTSGVLAGGPASDILNAEPLSAVPLQDAPPTAKANPESERGGDEPEQTIVENIEPIMPVEPASGWLDDDGPTEIDAVHQDPLDLTHDEVTAAPAPVESSDIFAGRTSQAQPIESSDVIAATAFGAATSAEPDVPRRDERASDVALSFDQPPGGSTVQEEGGSGDLPVADEMPDSSESLFDAAAQEPPSPFDSATLADAPPLPTLGRPIDTPDFGATPNLTPDASSILADLTEPGEITLNDSSSVRLDAPGVERTLSSNQEAATEFDLSIGDSDAPPELDAAAGEDSTDWDKDDPDMFADARTAPEMNLDVGSGTELQAPVPEAVEEDPSFTSSPSSIFSDKVTKPTGSGGSSKTGKSNVPIGSPDEEDASVEFSANPTAEDEASASRVFGPVTPAPSESPLRRPTPPSDVDLDLTKPSPDDPTKLPDPDSGMVEWSVAENDGSSVGLPQAAFDSPSSAVLEPTKLPAQEQDATKPGKPAKAAPIPPAGRPTSDPSVEIDWMAGSSSEEPALRADEPEEEEVAVVPKVKDTGKGKAKARPEPAKPARREPEDTDKAAPRKRGGGLLVGTLLGLVVGGGGFAGAYFGGLLEKDKGTAKTQPGQQNQTGGQGGDNTGGGGQAPQLTAADVAAAVRAGDPAKAKQIAATLNDTTPAGKAVAGEAQLFSVVQEQKIGEPIAADHPDLKAARENLQAVFDNPEASKTPETEKAAVKAAIQLGVTHQLAGDFAAAKKVYEDAMKKFPKHAATFEAALDRLAATAPATEGTSRRITPADAEALVVLLVLLQEPPAKDDDTEAGVFFWKAVKLANGGEYAKAVEEIVKAKAAHAKQAKAMAGRGLNPLSDPLEQIFLKSCDDLKAYWELRGAIYNNKPIADLFKSNGAEKAVAELALAQKKAAEAVKVMTELTETKTKLTDATDKLAKSQKDLKDATDAAAVLKKDLDATDKLRLEISKKLDTATTDLKTAEKEARDRADVVTALAKELQAIKLLPEKFDNAELLAAQKAAAARATGPSLNALLGPGMIAIGGAGLTTGQLIDISERLLKSEAAAKIATDKLATETKRLTTEHAAELKILKDGHTAEVKKLTDTYTTETKKLMETFATDVGNLKKDQAAELKKTTDKYTVDLKKLTDDNVAAMKKVTDDNAAAVKKLTDGYEGKVKDLEKTVVSQKAEADALAAKFKTDLGNALSPAQSLDIWLPLLTDLRRPADADDALATANKVLGNAPADSEDAAKARTVAGMALLLKGELPLAKAMFQKARSSPAFKTSRDKAWAKAADTGLASVDDPLAPYRQPVVIPARDPQAAARFLDAGINAYRGGRYSDAITALTNATKSDSTNALAWYFLGASQWGLGATDEAKKNFRDGATQEAAGTLTAKTISEALSPIQGAARTALDAVRP